MENDNLDENMGDKCHVADKVKQQTGKKEK